MNELAASSDFEFRIKIVKGPNKGASYKLMSAQITIGRGPDNDIILDKDQRCSRNHIKALLGQEGLRVQDISGRKRLVINNENVSEAVILGGGYFQIGDSVLQLDVTNKNTPALSIKTGHAMGRPIGEAIETPGAKQKSKKTFYIIIGATGLLFAFLLMPTEKKNDIYKINTDEQVKQKLNSLKQKDEDFRNLQIKRGKQSPRFKEAQIQFKKGFRDFENGHYSRAMSSFLACLSIQPRHSLCKRYLNLSQRKLDELARHYMFLGATYRDQNQYKACASAFKNVMTTVTDKNNKIYKEALANYKHCKLYLEERY